ARTRGGRGWGGPSRRTPAGASTTTSPRPASRGPHSVPTSTGSSAAHGCRTTPRWWSTTPGPEPRGPRDAHADHARTPGPGTPAPVEWGLVGAGRCARPAPPSRTTMPPPQPAAAPAAPAAPLPAEGIPAVTGAAAPRRLLPPAPHA